MNERWLAEAERIASLDLRSGALTARSFARAACERIALVGTPPLAVELTVAASADPADVVRVVRAMIRATDLIGLVGERRLCVLAFGVQPGKRQRAFLDRLATVDGAVVAEARRASVEAFAVPDAA